MRYDPREERPLGVSILAILDVALGAFTLFLGLLAGGPIGLLLDLAGAAFIAAGVGLWRLRPWAWTLSLVVTASGLVANLMQGLAGDGRAVFMALVQGALLAYLWAVRVHFGGRARARAPSNGSEA